MKKSFLAVLLSLLVLPLCACSAPSVYTVTREGTDYEVDREAGTVSDGANTYQYTFSGDSGAYHITIAYPNGSTWWWQRDSSGMGHGGWSEGYDESAYAKGDTLREVVLAKAPRAPGGHAGIGLLLIPIGLFHVIWPRAAWELSWGWRFKGAEPSKPALLANRAGGIAALLAAALLLL